MAASPLQQRVATGLVLVAVAVGALWAGGYPFALLAAAAVLIMFTEWTAMQRLPLLLRRMGLAVLAAAVWVSAVLGQPVDALVLLGGGAGLLGLFAGRMQRGTGRPMALGLLYCGLPAVALVWLRAAPWGFWATLFVMAVVWGADIAAYFTGRALGGPKLAPAISPNKTWSGAIGGLAGSLAVAGGMALLWPGYANAAGIGRLCALALPLAVASILGDLYESALKRRAGVKDSGRILPGHGGVMDRLDGLVPAAVLGAGAFAMTGWAG
ncbi:MAG: phosphatidate cytidylyltransferase [Sphingomonadales bacterium]|jgi:phosphatidate cytidylyltransferase